MSAEAERDRSRARPLQETGGLPERRESLWWLTAGPLLWALHFLACYLTAAIWCAKAGRLAELGWVRGAVAAYTVVALAGIGWTFLHGLRRHRHGAATVPHDFDTPGDRHRFLGFATLLLSGLSAVAVIYVALVAVFFGTCR